MEIESFGYSADEVQNTISKLNCVLRNSKQKVAREETQALVLFLCWLCFSFTGAFLSGFYLHYIWSFVFLGLFIAGTFVFYKKHKKI